MKKIVDPPKKYDWMISFRHGADSFLMKGASLPNVNPDFVSILSVFAAASIFFYRENDWWIFSMIFLSLLLDWLDGLIARKHNRATGHGYFLDIICDRLSELIIAIYSPLLWLPMFFLNLILTFLNHKTQVHMMMPLRAAFLIFLLFKLFGIDFGWI